MIFAGLEGNNRGLKKLEVILNCLNDGKWLFQEAISAFTFIRTRDREDQSSSYILYTQEILHTFRGE
jgi:hypothetical protein